MNTMPGYLTNQEQDDFLRLAPISVSSIKLSTYLTQHNIKVRKIADPSTYRFMSANGQYTDIGINIIADDLIIEILNTDLHHN